MTVAVTLQISDPFELADMGGLRASVLANARWGDAMEEYLLLRFEQNLSWAGVAYSHAVVLSRSGGGAMSEILWSGDSVDVNGVGVQADAESKRPPWGYDAWRGGLAFIGTLATG